MTPILARTLRDVEKFAAAAARVWIGNMLFKSPLDLGAVPVPCSVYEGHVPMYQSGDQNGAPKAPSVAIRAQSATWKREFGECHLNFAILTWNDDLSRNGYRDVENLAWRLNQGIYESAGIPAVLPQSDGSYLMSDGNLFQLTDHETSYELIDDPAVDFFPYFLGIYTAVFGIPTPGVNAGPWNELTEPTFTVTTPTPPEATPYEPVI